MLKNNIKYTVKVKILRGHMQLLIAELEVETLE